jgi:predicted RNA-binding Zn ribbon-like protein
MSRFEFIGGARPLDFINTVSWGDGGEERLRSYDDFLAWCRASRLPLGRGRDPRLFRKVLKLRAALHAAFRGRADGKRREPGPLLAFLSPALRQLTVRRGTWTLRDPDHAEAPLWWLAWEAAQLWTSADIDALRRCANDRCLWLFLDQSRRHNRRWCDMLVCGSRAKSRAYYARQSAVAASSRA